MGPAALGPNPSSPPTVAPPLVRHGNRPRRGRKPILRHHGDRSGLRAQLVDALLHPFQGVRADRLGGRGELVDADLGFDLRVCLA